MRHLVVIGDIVNSRHIRSRAAFQRRLSAALESISAANAAHLASPYTLTLGDEFQALYRRGGGLFADLCRIRAACFPAPVRFAVSVGSLTTAVNPRQALGMDGPAFHRARAMIDVLKQEERLFALGGDLPGDEVARTALIDLITAHMRTWKPNRWAVLLGLLSTQPVARLAAELGISEPAVYKNIQHGRLDSLATLLARLESMIDACLTGKNTAKHPASPRR